MWITPTPSPAVFPLSNIAQIVSAIGALGTAAFGLVDASKAFGGGVNHIGFPGIRRKISALTPHVPGALNALPQRQILATLRANWFNGTDLSSQKAIAKSLIKLYLSPENAARLAAATDVAPEILTQVAESIRLGTPLTTVQSDVYARFDLILTALLDETYQQADQLYRNGTRICAVFVSLLLANAAVAILQPKGTWPGVHEMALAFIVGLLAAPLAPIAKDLSTALATAVNAMQLVRK